MLAYFQIDEVTVQLQIQIELEALKYEENKYKINAYNDIYEEFLKIKNSKSSQN